MYQIHRRLPAELIDAIIDVSACDMETLKSFSVVSRSCIPRCRMHIFRSITFSADSGEDALAERHKQFLSILAREPQTAEYVRELFVEDRTHSSGHPLLPWIMTNVQFHETLSLIGLHLENFGLILGDYDWDNLPTSLKLSLMTIFTSPSLQATTLVGLENMPRACCAAIGHHIQEISMLRVSFSDSVDPDLPMVQAITPPSLEWLCLEDIDQKSIKILLDAWIPAPIQGHNRPLFPRLKSLSIGPTDEDEVVPLWELAQAGRASITCFLWEYFCGTRLVEPLSSQPLNLSMLKMLREFSYEVTVYPNDEDEDEEVNRPDHFDGLLSLLQTIEQDNGIQQVFIRFNFLTLNDVMESLEEYDGWDRLNSVLESERFLNLRGLALHLDVEIKALYEEHDMDVDIDLSEKRIRIETLIKEHVPVLLRHIESDPEAFMLVVEGEFVF